MKRFALLSFEINDKKCYEEKICQKCFSTMKLVEPYCNLIFDVSDQMYLKFSSNS